MNPKRIVTVVSIFPIIPAILESIGNPKFIENLLRISSFDVLGIVFVVLLVIRLKSDKFFNGKLVQIFLLSGISMLILCSILSAIGSLQGPNFIYSKTLLNLDRLFVLSTYLLSIGIIGQTNKVLGKYYKNILLLIGVCTPVLLFFISLLPFGFFEEIVKEKGLIENFQVVVLVVGVYYAFTLGMRFFASKKILYTVIFLALSFMFLLTAVDEVAWGQHHAGINAPDIIVDNNHQRELTLHNLNFVAGFVPFIYIVVGIYGAFARLVIKNKVFAPGSYLFFYFLLPAIYNVVSFAFIPGIGVWSEPAELLLYCGVVFHVIVLKAKT